MVCGVVGLVVRMWVVKVVRNERMMNVGMGKCMEKDFS